MTIEELLCGLQELLFLSVRSLRFQGSQVHALMQMKLCNVLEIHMRGNVYRTAFIEKVDCGSQVVRPPILFFGELFEISGQSETTEWESVNLNHPFRFGHRSSKFLVSPLVVYI